MNNETVINFTWKDMLTLQEQGGYLEEQNNDSLLFDYCRANGYGNGNYDVTLGFKKITLREV